MSPKEISIRLQSGIETGDRSAERFISDERYTQHNLDIPDGKAAILALVDSLPNDGMRARPVRAIEDGDRTAVHVDYDFFGPKAGIDIHRFENGLIVEHWDIFEAVVGEVNPAGRTMFDGPTDNGDLAKTEEAKALVRLFIERVAIAHEWSIADRFFRGDHLAQHHPKLDDGADAFLSYLGRASETDHQVAYERLHQVIGEGELVLAVSEGRVGCKPAAFFDLFRLRNGTLDELWTVSDIVPPLAQWKNQNGKF